MDLSATESECTYYIPPPSEAGYAGSEYCNTLLLPSLHPFYLFDLLLPCSELVFVCSHHHDTYNEISDTAKIRSLVSYTVLFTEEGARSD